MNNHAALALLLVCAGCAVSTGPSQREIQAMQTAGMNQALEMMRSPMEGLQDAMDGKDTEAARTYRQRTEALQQQGAALDREMRKDPRYARRIEESDREQREFRRKNPSGFQTEFDLSDAQEAELGFGMAQQFLSNQRLVADDGLQRYVNSVGMWVAQQSERAGLPWRFALIEGDAPNAFAVPGGYVFVSRGMLALAETESELAGILGHEISHVVRKHHLRWIYMNKDLARSMQSLEDSLRKSNPAGVESFKEMGRLAQRSIEQMNSPKMRAGLSQSEELEADIDGAILAWRAGYEAWGLVAVLQRFEAASRQRYAADEQALAGHPEPLQRLKILDAALRSRAEKDTTGEVGGRRHLDSTRSLRERRS